MNTLKTENDSKCISKLNETYRKCGKSFSNSNCLKKSLESYVHEVKLSKNNETNTCLKRRSNNSLCYNDQEQNFTNSKEAYYLNNNDRLKVRNHLSTALSAGGSSLNDSSNFDWTVSSIEISLGQNERPNNCTSSSRNSANNFYASENQNTRNSNLRFPRQSPRNVQNSRELLPQDRRGQRVDRAANWSRSVTTRDGRCRATDISPGRNSANGGRRTSSRQRTAAAARSRSNDGRRRCTENLNVSCPASFPEQPPSSRNTSRVCSDRGGTHQQQQQQSAVLSSNDYRSDPGEDWDPDVPGTYSAFTDSRLADINGSRFLTSERRIPSFDGRPDRVRGSAPPANRDFHANDDGDLSDDGSAGSDWSTETGLRFQTSHPCDNYGSGQLSTVSSETSLMGPRRRVPDRGDNAGRRDHSASSRSDNGRCPFDGDRREGRGARVQPIEDVSFPDLSSWASDEAVSDDDDHGANVQCIENVSFQDLGSWASDEMVSDISPTSVENIDDVSMPDCMVNHSLSSTASGSGRIRDIEDEKIPDFYDTSCSVDDSASRRDEDNFSNKSSSIPNNRCGRGFRTGDDDGDVGPAPCRSRRL